MRLGLVKASENFQEKISQKALNGIGRVFRRTRSSGKTLSRHLSWKWETGNNSKLIIGIFSGSYPYSICNGRISIENMP
jgi:hypothetical protein